MMLALLLLFGVLQAADIYTTYTLLSSGGRELNPVMRWAMDKLGMVRGLVIMKLLTVGLVVVLFNEALTFWLCIFYAGVVGWNTYQLYKG